jgi:hypothetical protein
MTLARIIAGLWAVLFGAVALAGCVMMARDVRLDPTLAAGHRDRATIAFLVVAASVALAAFAVIGWQ